jgi:nicotinate-nucleotide adenylyltransferase
VAKRSKIGVLGGTFDPPHIGHLAAASSAADALGLELMLFVPAGHPWQKRSYSPAEDRFIMTVLTVAGRDPRFAASRMEVDRAGPSYTVDSVAELRSFYGDEVDLMFVVGADALAGIVTWVGLDRLTKRAEIVGVSRPGRETVLRAPAEVPVRLLEIPPVDVSSTDVRARVAAGRSLDGAVTPAVARYIERRDLYSAPAEVGGA